MQSTSTVQSGDYAQLPSDVIATLRRGIRGAQGAGISLDAIDKDVQAKYGVTVKQVMEPNPSDFGRAVSQGLTLGHADELAGLYAKLTGKSYKEARDAVRNNDTEFQAIHPLLKAITEGVAGAIPGTAASPLAGIQKGQMLANVARGAATGAGLGAVAGEGNSNAPTMGGVAQSAALSGVAGGVLGAGGSAIASKLASMGSPFGNATPVANEVAAQIPSDPVAQMTTQAMLARQQQLAPGTVVLGDMSPQMQKFIRVVGADPKTAMLAKDDAATRLNALLAAKKSVGRSYDILQGAKAPADQAITDALEQAGRRDLVQNGQVDLGKLHELRSALVKVGSRPNSGMRGTELKQSAANITDWLADPNGGNATWLKQNDADYAFLTERAKAAQQTLKTVANSTADYAANRVIGRTPASLGGSISVPTSPSAVGIVIQKLAKPNPVARAQAIRQLLLSPQRDADQLQRLMVVHDALLQSQSSPFQSALQAGGTGAGVQGLNALVRTPQTP